MTTEDMLRKLSDTILTSFLEGGLSKQIGYQPCVELTDSLIAIAMIHLQDEYKTDLPKDHQELTAMLEDLMKATPL